jgi:hypothetical protein
VIGSGETIGETFVSLFICNSKVRCDGKTVVAGKGVKVWLSAEGKAATIALLASVTFLQRLSSNLFEDLQKAVASIGSLCDRMKSAAKLGR